MDENQNKIVINELKPFDKQVDDVLSGADTTSSHLEVLKVTPPLLRMVGVPNLPILMTARHVRTITQDSGTDSANYHGLGVELIKRLPELISDPVMIMDSLTKDDSIVVVTQTVDKENRPVIGAIRLGGKGYLNSIEMDANILSSAYGREGFQSFIDRNIAQGKVLYVDKEKSQELAKIPGIQFPDNFATLDFDTIIRKTNAFVNREEEKNSANNNSPLVINLFAGPSAGKTTAALELTAALKKKGFNVEYVSEYAKELVLENKTELLKNQVHVTDEQYHRLDRLRKSGVQIIVTDSPVLLGKVYGEGRISQEYGEKILTYHNSFNNFNLFVNRGDTFQTEGRVHNLEQSKELDAKITDMLQDSKIFFGYYNHDEIDKTVDRITTTFSHTNGRRETTEKNEGSMTADTNNANAQSAREHVLKVRDDMVKMLLAHIEKNPTDWQSGWNNIAAGAPYNGKTSTAYRGLNALYLAFLGAERGYKDTRWVTFNQAKELGASVKKGEKSSPVIFFEFYDRKTKKAFDNRTVKDMTDEEKTVYLKENVYAVMKYSSVFNAEQCHNFPERKEIAMSEEERANQNAKIETIIANSAAPVRYDGGSRAYYSPGTDSIHLPVIAAFDTMQDYYATALHEIAHSTGHESRLNRDLAGGFGSESYAKEELRAELACVFMQMEQGIQLNGKHITNHAAYLNSWLEAAKNDTSVFFKAAADAQKIADYVAENYMQAADSAVIEEENVAQAHAEEQPERNPMADYLRAEQLNRSTVSDAGERQWEQENIRDWYTSAYPNDEAGLDIHPNATFKDLREEVNRPNPISVYGMLGEDSIVRERTFTRLAELSGSYYASIYAAFLGETAQQKLENARALAKRLATETGEPYVTIEDSEHHALNSYDVMSLSEADKKLAALDAQEDKHEGYYKTKLHIDYVFEGSHNSYECCRFDIGSEGGGLVHHIDEFLKHDTFLDTEERQEAENALKYFKVHMDLSAMVDTAIASELPLQEQFNVQGYVLEARGAVNSAVPFSTYELPEMSSFEQEENTVAHQFLNKTKYGSPVSGIIETERGHHIAIINNNEQKEVDFPDGYPSGYLIAQDYNPDTGEFSTAAYGFVSHEEARKYLIEQSGFDIGQSLEAERSEEDYITQARNEIAEFDAGSQATDGNQRFYYPINEEAARHAKEANSYSDYKEGSATAEYRRSINRAVEIATEQKAIVDPMYHERIDALLDSYAKRLAANINEGNAIDARMPSYLITGGGNFNVGKKQKQNAARDRNHQEWQEIQSILDRIRSTGKGGISSDDPNSIQKLTAKLEGLEKAQETMKAVNAYYRKNKTLDGCPELTAEQIAELKADMKRFPHLEGKPYPTWALSNNNAEIRRVKERIEELSKRQEGGFVGWEFNGGEVRANTADNRLQIFFEEKPDEETRSDLKHNGFKWSPKANAWQRQLTENAYYAADRIKAIQPLSGEKPTALQRAYIRQHNAEVASNVVQREDKSNNEFDKGTTYYDVWWSETLGSSERSYHVDFYSFDENGVVTRQSQFYGKISDEVLNATIKERLGGQQYIKLDDSGLDRMRELINEQSEREIQNQRRIELEKARAEQKIISGAEFYELSQALETDLNYGAIDEGEYNHRKAVLSTMRVVDENPYNRAEQKGDHEEKLTVEQARNAMLDAQEQRQRYYAVRIENVPYTDPEDGYESEEPAQVIYTISQTGRIEQYKTLPLDDDVFSSDLPYGGFISYEPVEYDELEKIANKVYEPIQVYKDVLRAELEAGTEQRRSEAYYDQRVEDILDEHYRTEYGLFKRDIENPKYLSGKLYAEGTFRGERVVSLTQDESGKNVAIIARIGGSFAVAEDYHTDDGRNWGKYHSFDDQKSAEEFRAKAYPTKEETALFSVELKALRVLMQQKPEPIADYVEIEGNKNLIRASDLVIKYGGKVVGGHLIKTPELKANYSLLQYAVMATSAITEAPEIRDYNKIKQANPDSIVLYRTGDFFEVLGADAARVADKLELTLTGRTIGAEERVPMCGVPYHAIDQYADTLAKKGESVIIADGTNIREHKAKINLTEKRLRDYADTLRRNDLEVGSTAQTDEYYLNQARELIAEYERSDEYQQALREDFPNDFIDDSPQDMAQIPQNKPVEAQERKREWLSIELPNGAVGVQYGENTMIKMPQGEFSYYAFYVPTKMLKDVDGKTQLRIASDYMFRLNNDGRQVELTGQELKDSFAGKHLDKTYKRVAPSRKYAQGLTNLEKNVPAELKAIPTWCCYRTRWNEEKGKKDKFIISPIDGKWTSSKEPGKWVTFDAAMKYARENNCEGLSVLLDKKYGITCIDLDKCIINAETGEMKERATKLVEALSGTYIERSTSGNGLHIFVKDDILKNGTYNSQSMVKDDDLRGDLEVFDDKRIMSLTGDMYSKGNTLTRAGSAATVYLRQELGERRSIASNGTKTHPTASQSLSDSELIRWIRGSKQGAKFDDLYSGRGVSGDRSNDDGKLAHILLYFNGGDKDQAFRIMRESGAYRSDKPDSYYRHTIDKMNDKIEVYAKHPTSSADGLGKPKGKGPWNGKKGNQA